VVVGLSVGLMGGCWVIVGSSAVASAGWTGPGGAVGHSFATSLVAWSVATGLVRLGGVNQEDDLATGWGSDTKRSAPSRGMVVVVVVVVIMLIVASG
jgi:hypothetical protein